MCFTGCIHEDEFGDCGTFNRDGRPCTFNDGEPILIDDKPTQEELADNYYPE